MSRGEELVTQWLGERPKALPPAKLAPAPVSNPPDKALTWLSLRLLTLTRGRKAQRGIYTRRQIARGAGDIGPDKAASSVMVRDPELLVLAALLLAPGSPAGLRPLLVLALGFI